MMADVYIAYHCRVDRWEQSLSGAHPRCAIYNIWRSAYLFVTCLLSRAARKDPTNKQSPLTQARAYVHLPTESAVAFVCPARVPESQCKRAGVHRGGEWSKKEKFSAMSYPAVYGPRRAHLRGSLHASTAILADKRRRSSSTRVVAMVASCRVAGLLPHLAVTGASVNFLCSVLCIRFSCNQIAKPSCPILAVTGALRRLPVASVGLR
jgi:hypothetical protein